MGGEQNWDRSAVICDCFIIEEERATNLFHDACLTLRERNVATRLITDELDLNLATLAAAFLIVIIVIVGSAGALALGAAALGDVAGLLQVVGRGLVVLIWVFGHFEMY